MHSFSNTRNKSYSESDLELMNSFNDSRSSMQNSVIIRRTVCTEEVIPSFVPFETGFYNKISSPHRRKSYHQYKTNINLSRPIASDDIEFQIANLDLTNNQSNQSFSSFSYCSPKPKNLTTNIKSPPNLKHIADTVEKSNLDIEETPMDVDSFEESKNKSKTGDSDVTRNECTSQILPIENALRLRNLRAQPMHNDKITVECRNIKTDLGKNLKKLIFTICTLTIIGICCSCFFADTMNSDSKEFSLDNLKHDLSKVYKQKNVVNIIIQSLMGKDSWPENKKTLVFFGSSGVGKTFVTNILKANFPQQHVHEIDWKLLDNIEVRLKVLNNLESNALNLLIIDDIQNNCTANLVNFLKDIDFDTKILTIAVFSTVEVNENLEKTINLNIIPKIETDFNNLDFKYDSVVFNDFTNNDVRQWIKNELFLLQVPVELHENIVDNVMRYNIQMTGLKELHSKIGLEISDF